MRAYFTLKLGWSKTNAGTNIGPQNDMYLSVPGQDCQLIVTHLQRRSRSRALKEKYLAILNFHRYWIKRRIDYSIY